MYKDRHLIRSPPIPPKDGIMMYIWQHPILRNRGIYQSVRSVLNSHIYKTTHLIDSTSVSQDAYKLSVEVLDVFKILNFNWWTYSDTLIDISEHTLFKILNIEQFINLNVWNSIQQM